MRYYCYGYHEAPTEPVTYETTAIYGLELEIDNPSEEIHRIMDLCIERDIITVPCNEDRTQNLKVMENDGSVWKEIILRADTVENLLERVKCLNENGVNPTNFNNTAGTSAHIHINRDELQDRGISATNIVKMFEFFAPIIFKMSGRGHDEFRQWARPISDYPLNMVDWKRRGEIISALDVNYSNRYQLVNCRNDATIELRGFSNACSFDYDTIKSYFAFVEFVLDECEYMVGRYYRDEGLNIIQHFKEWVTKEEVSKFNLSPLFLKDISLSRIAEVRPNRFRLHSLRRISQYPNLLALADFLDTYPQYNKPMGYHITTTNRGIKNAVNRIITHLTNKNGEFFNLYRENKELLNRIIEGDI